MSLNSPADLATSTSRRERESEWATSAEGRAQARAEFAEVSLYEIGHWLARHAKVLMIGAAIGFLVCVAIAFSRPRTYTSSASFIPQTNNNSNARLSGLAAQLGVSLGSQTSQSPAFYVDILKSDELLGVVADAKYTRERADSATLQSILEISGGTVPQQHLRVVRNLQSALRVTSGRETGIVRVMMTARSPVLAQQLAAQLLRALDDFNLRMRQEQAVAERTFAKDRLGEIMAELRGAEGRLQDFLRQNRIYANSPDLRADYERLQRDVQMRQQLYMSMAQAYEQARIDAVRSTPVISVLERPSYPANPDSRGGVVAGLVGILLGTMGAMVFVLLRERRRQISQPS
jgi:uncharacterized protein involved in exopolysaccharide biosynthesis